MKLLIGLIALLGTAVATPAFADKDVKFNKLPIAVQATVKNQVKDGVIMDIEKEKEAGLTVYEIEFLDNNKNWVIDVAPDGTLLSRMRD